MKNVLLIALMLCSIAITAQDSKGDRTESRKEMRQKMKDLTPEQVASLKTKKMTLQLDLTETQQAKVEELQLEIAKKRKEHFENRKDRKELTSDELFEKRSEMLDGKIALKAKMKSILTEEQYQKWEKGLRGKHKRMRKHTKKEGRS